MKIDIQQVEYKILDKSAIPRLLEMQEEAFAANKGSKDFLRRNTYQTLEECFYDKSLVVGAYFGDEMIAFGILLDAGESNENLAKDVAIIEDRRLSANIKLIIVRPQFQGNRLQRQIINYLEDYARQNGFEWLCTTVSPSNKYSLDNVLGCGFQQYAILQKYGGLSRILFIKKI